VAGFYNRRVTLRGAQIDGSRLVSDIRAWARESGFSQIGVAGVDLSSAEPGLSDWLARGFHGEMHYMAAHGLRRARPAELVPGTVSVITARMDYLPAATQPDWPALELLRLQRPGEAVVSVYARGRDYHKVLRARLQKLCERIAQQVGPFGHRVFTDSAPVLEAELAARSGQGWRGKHTLMLSREAGSMFFWARSMWTWRCHCHRTQSPHCGSAAPASTCVPRRPSWRPDRWTRGVASRT
jgi:epoxyqueuosine reductase